MEEDIIFCEGFVKHLFAVQNHSQVIFLFFHFEVVKRSLLVCAVQKEVVSDALTL